MLDFTDESSKVDPPFTLSDGLPRKWSTRAPPPLPDPRGGAEAETAGVAWIAL